ncbi:MAG: endo-1,4-beta-xylanase [Chloroflexi bacterium]|nr:endo-1,4-beta-xylanase [Chloroflexota bacterium]
MKIKNIVTVLLVAFILVSCAPAANIVPTETAVPTLTVTPIPSTPTTTSTPAPENLADAKDLSKWVDDYVHAYGGKVIVNGAEMDASQLTDEIRKNPEAFTQIKNVNGIDSSFLAVNGVPLAMQGSDDLWKDIGYKDVSPDGLEVGASFAIWTGDYDNDSRYGKIFADNFTIAATDGELSDYELMKKIPNDKKLTPQEVLTYYDWTNFDKVITYSKANNIPIRAMHLLDGYTTDSAPQWLQQMSDDELREYIKLHLTAILTRTDFKEASVVSEAFYGAGIPGNNFFYAKLGEKFIEDTFAIAQDVSPHTALILNDNIVYGSHGENSDDGVWTNSVINGESNAIFNFVSKKVSNGVPINGVGIETHIMANDFVSKDTDGTIEKYKKDLMVLMEKYKNIGVDVYFTELDINIAGLPSDLSNQQKQELKAKVFRAIFEACLNSINCKSVTTWGFSDKATWMFTDGYPYGAGESPLPLDINYQPTISNYVIKQVLFEHWIQP